MTDDFQLSDVAFQRHILVQALILIDFLLTLTESSKSKPFYQNAQKAMQYHFTLGPEQVSLCRHCPGSSPLRRHASASRLCECVCVYGHKGLG